MKIAEPLVFKRKVSPAKRRAAGRHIEANIKRLPKKNGGRTATQALAEARGERLAR